MDQNSSNLRVEWFDPPLPLVRVAATRRAGRSRCPARSAPPPPQLAVRLDCAAAAVSIRVVQPIALRHRLRSSSRQQPERASGTGSVAVSSSCKKRSSARTASPRSSSPTPTSDPPVSSSRVPGHPNLLYCPCYSTATARFSFNLVICVCSN